MTDDEPSRLHMASVQPGPQPQTQPGFRPGWQVRYRRRTHDSLQDWQEFTGTIAGPSLRDVHKDTTWTPVLPSDAGEYTPVQLVRERDILEVREGPERA